jgi:hypothetical protein
VPAPAQDRIGRGPFGALLILLSLLLGSGTGAAAAAGSDLRQPTARLGASRHAAAAALVPSGIRNPLDEDSPGAGSGAAPPPPAPGLVTRALPARPAAGPLAGQDAAHPGRPAASYRARAPPAA